MTPLRPETTAEVADALDHLGSALLSTESWAALSDHVAELDRALATRDEVAVRAALVPVSRAVFEAKVRSRLGSHRAGASIVVPTKKTPALPAVGAVCATILVLLGWQLGGGLVALATGLLALLVLVVALAGTHTNAERSAARRARSAEPDERIPAPADVASRLAEVRARARLV